MSLILINSDYNIHLISWNLNLMIERNANVFGHDILYGKCSYDITIEFHKYDIEYKIDSSLENPNIMVTKESMSIIVMITSDIVNLVYRFPNNPDTYQFPNIYFKPENLSFTIHVEISSCVTSNFLKYDGTLVKNKNQSNIAKTLLKHQTSPSTSIKYQ